MYTKDMRYGDHLVAVTAGANRQKVLMDMMNGFPFIMSISVNMHLTKSRYKSLGD